MQSHSVLATRATRTTRFSVRDAKSIAAGATYSKHCSCSLIDLLQLHRWLMLCVRHGKNANMQRVPEASNASSYDSTCEAQANAIKRGMSIGLTSSLFCTTTNHVRIHQLSEATRPALGGLLRTLSWHDELSAKELELGRDLTSLPLKSMPKSRAIVRSQPWSTFAVSEA